MDRLEKIVARNRHGGWPSHVLWRVGIGVFLAVMIALAMCTNLADPTPLPGAGSGSASVKPPPKGQRVDGVYLVKPVKPRT